MMEATSMNTEGRVWHRRQSLEYLGVVDQLDNKVTMSVQKNKRVHATSLSGWSSRAVAVSAEKGNLKHAMLCVCLTLSYAV